MKDKIVYLNNFSKESVYTSYYSLLLPLLLKKKFTFYIIGECNLKNYKEVFMAFENKEMSQNLYRFLMNQIKEAK